MEKVEVIFYDGQSSVGNKAILGIGTKAWTIEYLDLEFNEQISTWNINEINRVEIISGIPIFRYGDSPQQILEFIDDSSINLLREYYPNAKFLKTNPLRIKSDWKYLASASLILISLLSFIYFIVLPPAAELLAGQIPQQVEIDLGEALLSSFISNSEKDKNLSVLLNKFASNINFHTSYPIEIIVVKVEEVNAFALPGGKVVIYDHILKKMNSSEELSALLSHEIAHIHYKHSLKSISRSLSGYIFISLLFNDINGMTTLLVDNANAFNNLSYSRTLETDADEKALITLEKNKIDQKGLVRLFEILKAQGDYEFLKFLSTHPLSSDRIKYAKESAKRQKFSRKNKTLDNIWLNIKKHSK